MAKYEFEADDFVFAKRPGHSFWPARISNVQDGKYFVHFYGNKESRLVKDNELFPYDKYRYEFCIPSRLDNKHFCNAVKQINMSIRQYNAIAKLNQTNKYINIVFNNDDSDDDDDDDDNNENDDNQKNKKEAVNLQNNVEFEKINLGNVSLSDKKTKFLTKEKDMLLLYKRIVESLFENKPKFNKTLKQLRILKEFQIHIEFLMLIKAPIFLNTLERVCNYTINDEYLKNLNMEQQSKISKKIQKIRNEANEIIVMLKDRLCVNLPKNKTFEDFYNEEIKNFEDKTKDMPFGSKMLITSTKDYIKQRKIKK